MSDLDNAINSINASAAKAENTATFLDDMSTFDDQSSVTNPNNGQTVASIPKQVKDRTDELFTAAESDINQAVSDAAQSATDAQDAADSIGRYQGLWPDTGGIADKGDTYQTQVSGTPTGQYFTALQNTTADPVGDNVNWREVISTESINNYAVTPYKHSSGKSAVDNMISSSSVGDICSAEGTVWERVSGTSGDISDFKILNLVFSGGFDNGLSDKYQGIQDSVNLNSETVLTNGTSDISDTISFNGLGSGNIRGQGFYNTILRLTTDNKYAIDTNSISGVRLAQMRIEGDNLTSSGGVNIDNAFYSLFEGIDVRGTQDYSYKLTNTNNNTFNNVSSHNTFGSGWLFDATSQHNTLNACGAEDWSGYGIEMRGIGNVLNAPWIENRDSDSFATDVAILIANRDNVVLAPEIRSASTSKPLSRGILMSADSARTLLVNPHFDNCTQPIRLEGQDKYRILIGVDPSDVTDVQGDDTTLIQNGNTVSSKFRHISDAPVIEYESENGASGVQHRLLGSASGAMFRWQLGLDTQVQIDSNGDFTPGTANTKRLGTNSKPFNESHVTTSFSDAIRMTPLSSAPVGQNGETLAISDGTVDGTFGASGEGLYRLNISGVWVFLG